MTKIQEINTETQEVIERDANEFELNMIQLQKEAYEQRQAEAEAKAQAKAAAEAKLAAFGLTTEDLKALGLGGN